MSSKNYSNLLKLCYSYLRYKVEDGNKDIEDSCIRAIKELEEISSFKYRYVELNYLIDELNKEPYLKFLKGAETYYLVSTTLGVMVDKRIHLLSKTDMSYMVIFNACAAAYLEYLADNYEKENLGEDISYRFCPGYAGTSVSDLVELKKYINPEKIGIQVFDSGMMLPEKSMIGIVARNKNNEKTCESCVLDEKCIYRKDGKKCYS